MLRLFPLLVLTACGPSRTDVKEAEEQSDYHYDLAYGHYMDPAQANADAAIQEILTALKHNPKSARAHMLAGVIFMGRERYIDAEQHFKAALVEKPDYYDVQNNLGAVYLATERWDDAIGLFDALAGNLNYKNPGNAQNNLGWAWYQKGNLAKAKTHFHSAISLAPKLCPPYNNLAMVHIEQNRAERAKKYLGRAIKRCPTYAEPHFHLGRVLFRERNLPAARERFTRCLRLAGESPLADRCENRLKGLPPVAVKR